MYWWFVGYLNVVGWYLCCDFGKYMLNYGFLDWLLVFVKQESRKIGVEFSNFADRWAKFEFLWIIGLAKIPETFIVGCPRYWKMSYNVPRIFDILFVSHEFFIESTSQIRAEILLMIWLLWAIVLEKNYKIFTLGYSCYLEVLCEVS